MTKLQCCNLVTVFSTFSSILPNNLLTETYCRNLFFTGKRAFRFQLSGPVINLFIFHETVDVEGCNKNLRKNKIIFSMDVNYHQVSTSKIVTDEKLLGNMTLPESQTNFDNSDMYAVIHTIEDGKHGDNALKSINDVSFPDGRSISVTHPKKIAKHIRKFKWARKSRRSADYRFEDSNDDQAALFSFLELFNNVFLRDNDDLSKLYKKLLGPKGQDNWKCSDDFHESYQRFHKWFQDRFNLYFSFMDGNHRATIISKLMHVEKITDNYYHDENEKYPEWMKRETEKVFGGLFSVKIEYHSTELIDPLYAKKISADLRQSQLEHFGTKYADVFTSFAKSIDNFASCTDDNFYLKGYGTGRRDQYMDNVDMFFHKMLCTASIYNREMKLDITEVEKAMKNKKSYYFKPFLPSCKKQRKEKMMSFKFDEEKEIQVPSEVILIVDILKLFCADINMLHKYNNFMRHPYVLEKMENTSTNFKCDLNESYFVKDLLSTVFRMSYFLCDALVRELSIMENHEETTTVNRALPTERIKTFMSISILQEIIEVWDRTGHDPKIMVAELMWYGTTYTHTIVSNIVSGGDNTNKKPFLIYLLDEYENHQRAYFNLLEVDRTRQDRTGCYIFNKKFKERICKKYGHFNNRNSCSKMDDFDKNFWTMEDFRMKDTNCTINGMVYLMPSFTTFMGFFYPCLLTDEKKTHLQNEDKNILFADYLLAKYTYKDNNKHVDFHIEEYYTQRYVNWETGPDINNQRKNFNRADWTYPLTYSKATSRKRPRSISRDSRKRKNQEEISEQLQEGESQSTDTVLQSLSVTGKGPKQTIASRPFDRTSDQYPFNTDILPETDRQGDDNGKNKDSEKDNKNSEKGKDEGKDKDEDEDEGKDEDEDEGKHKFDENNNNDGNGKSSGITPDEELGYEDDDDSSSKKDQDEVRLAKMKIDGDKKDLIDSEEEDIDEDEVGRKTSVEEREIDSDSSEESIEDTTNVMNKKDVVSSPTNAETEHYTQHNNNTDPPSEIHKKEKSTQIPSIMEASVSTMSLTSGKSSTNYIILERGFMNAYNEREMSIGEDIIRQLGVLVEENITETKVKEIKEILVQKTAELKQVKEELSNRETTSDSIGSTLRRLEESFFDEMFEEMCKIKNEKEKDKKPA